MADEYFYGVSLDKAGASVTWDSFGTTEDVQPTNYKLQIRQVLLGHTAKEDEYNVVQVETLSVRNPVKIPIAVLKVGETRSLLTDLEFPDSPVIFKLIEGNGPVHILGQQLPFTYDFEDSEEIEEEILDEEEGDIQDEDDDDESNPRKKAKLASNNSRPVPKGGVQNSNNKNHKKK